VSSQLTFFKDCIPKRPYSTNSFKEGLFKVPQIEAITKKYIQHNPYTHYRWIVLDIDRAGGGVDWKDEPLPAPNIVAENKSNFHAHLFFGLDTPVRVNALDSRKKPIRYLASIENALIKEFGADPNYAGLISKNPLSTHWNVYQYEKELYNLDLLSDYVNLEPYKDRRKNLPNVGFGRNVNLFSYLRKWAYRAFLKHFDINYGLWLEIVTRQAMAYNTGFHVPLHQSEIVSMSRSVARWIFNNFTERDFIEIQRKRGLKSGRARKEKADKKNSLINFALTNNPLISNNQLSKELNIPLRTIERERKKLILDNKTATNHIR